MRNKYLAAVDIGTSKVAAIVGEKTSVGIKIIGYSELPSEGVVRGEIIKSQKVSATVSAALRQVTEQIQAQPDTEGAIIKNVYVNISGPNIRCVPGSVHRDRPDPLAPVDKDEIASMLEQMYSLDVDSSEKVLYVSPQYYNVDEHMGETDPEDMDGKTIDGEYKVFIGKAGAVEHCRNAVSKAGIACNGMILTPIASGAALLTDNEKELGSVLIDIGAGTTDVIIYHGNIMRYAAVIPFGGNSITEDISQTCSISMKTAEQLKIQRGTCISEFAKENRIIIKEGGMTVQSVPSKLLSKAIEARICEILATVRHIIEISGFRTKLRSRAVITGGSARLGLIQLLAKNILNMDVRFAMPDSTVITGNSAEQAFRPQAATAVGLIVEGFRLEETRPLHQDENSGPDIQRPSDTYADEEQSLFGPDDIETVPSTDEKGKDHVRKDSNKEPSNKKKRNFREILTTLFPSSPEDDDA
ncbi:MAG TPA: cell division protein FtsA [Candidatus Coprenecus pullistercoris]|nr:cell division protein FtsA [Candidatus Coprenecus pullistercoris]